MKVFYFSTFKGTMAIKQKEYDTVGGGSNEVEEELVEFLPASPHGRDR